MHMQDRERLEIETLREQIADLKTDIHDVDDRVSGLWWKIGILAGLVGTLMSKVFGETVGAFVGPLLGGF